MTTKNIAHSNPQRLHGSKNKLSIIVLYRRLSFVILRSRREAARLWDRLELGT